MLRTRCLGLNRHGDCPHFPAGCLEVEHDAAEDAAVLDVGQCLPILGERPQLGSCVAFRGQAFTAC